MNIGERIRKQREKQYMTQTELAIRSGCKQQEISLYETGKSVPTISRIMNIGVALGTNMWELIGEGEKDDGSK